MSDLITRAEYNAIMAKESFTKKEFDAATAFAKAKRVRKPAADKVAAKAPKAPRVPKEKVACSVEDCAKDSRVKGMCMTHYTRLVYRANPDNAAKAREASAKYAQKIRDRKAAEKADAETSAA